MKAKELTELGQWKVGQEVSLHGDHYRSTHLIERITDGRGGTIYLDNTFSTFDANGRIRSSSSWDTQRIEPMTPEIKEGIIKANRRNKLKNFDFASLTFDQASDLVLKMREMGIVI
jgi:hypothetical protein